MESPFKTADDYLNATGTLHSFTGHPGSATLMLILSVLVTLYFLYKSFTIHH
jgi:hypothetical protein